METIATDSNRKSMAKEALMKWHQDEGISIRDFAEAMDYRYTYAWDLLRGNAMPSEKLVGRMLAAYGPNAAQLISDALNGSDGSLARAA